MSQRLESKGGAVIIISRGAAIRAGVSPGDLSDYEATENHPEEVGLEHVRLSNTDRWALKVVREGVDAATL